MANLPILCSRLRQVLYYLASFFNQASEEAEPSKARCQRGASRAPEQACVLQGVLPTPSDRLLPQLPPTVCPAVRAQLHHLAGGRGGVSHRSALLLPRLVRRRWQSGRPGRGGGLQPRKLLLLLTRAMPAMCHAYACELPAPRYRGPDRPKLLMRPLVMGTPYPFSPPPSDTQISERAAFYASAGAGLAGFLLTVLFLPDTTGLDLHEIDRMNRYLLAGHLRNYHGGQSRPGRVWLHRLPDLQLTASCLESARSGQLATVHMSVLYMLRVQVPHLHPCMPPVSQCGS